MLCVFFFSIWKDELLVAVYPVLRALLLMRLSTKIVCSSCALIASVLAAWKLLRRESAPSKAQQVEQKPNEQLLPAASIVPSNVKIVVFYASCGGTAKTLANLLTETLGDRGVGSVALVTPDNVTDLDSFTAIMTTCQLCLGIVATTGDGSVPQDFQRIFSYMRSATKPWTEACHFSILGLGDSKYQQFCKAGNDVAKCCTQGGLSPCISDSGILHSDATSDPTHSRTFGNWMESILAIIPTYTGLVVGPLSISPPTQRRFQVQSLASAQSVDAAVTVPFVLSPSMMEPTPTRPARLLVKQVTPCLKGGSEHQIVHVALDVRAYPRLTYEAGDHIGILPPNSNSCVDELLMFIGAGSVEADACVRVQLNTMSAARATPASMFPLPVVSWRFVLTWYLDISRIPVMQSIQHIIRCCQATAAEKERMMGLVANVDAYQAMLDSLAEQLRHRAIRLVDVLRLVLPETKSVPLDRLCECLPSLQPRYYSIASDPVSHTDGSLEILVRVIDDGVASQHLASFPQHVYGFIRKSTFHLPKGRNKSVLMIGPGTGLAPLLGFLHRRGALMKKQLRSSNASVGNTNKFINDQCQMWLFHGCRHKEDWTHYLEGLVQPHIDSHTLHHRFVCFSREDTPPSTGARRYVQHMLEERASDIVAVLLHPTTVVFICGDAKRMARDVRETLERILCTFGGLEPHAAAHHIKKMMLSQRYLEDVW
jgi:NADPH-ferrihemoprotein reductase